MQSWVESGKGSQPLYNSSDEWAKETEHLTALAEKVSAKLKEAGVVMQSKSGEAMQNAVAPVVQWTEVTAENTKAQSQLMREQGDAYNKVKSAIPAKSEVQSVPDDNWIEEGWDNMVNGQTDAEAAKEHNEKLRQEAVTAFNGYDNASQSTVSASAVFTPPPSSTSEVAVSGGQHTGVGGMTPAPGGGSPAGSGSAGYSGGGAGGGYSGGGSGGSGGGGGTGGGGGGGGSSTNPVWNNPTQPPNQWPDRTGPTGPNRPGPGIPPVVGPVPGGSSGPGRPGGPGAGGGRGGAGGGTGAGGRSGAGAGRGALGPGGQSGVGAGGGRAGAGGDVGAGGRGGAGMAGAGAGARGRGQEGEDDLEHETPEYLKGDQGVFDDGLPKVAPPVFGDWNQK
ncbi:PPE domain-containing protein [Saccharopolyspora taberi]